MERYPDVWNVRTKKIRWPNGSFLQALFLIKLARPQLNTKPFICNVRVVQKLIESMLLACGEAETDLFFNMDRTLTYGRFQSPLSTAKNERDFT